MKKVILGLATLIILNACSKDNSTLELTSDKITPENKSSFTGIVSNITGYYTGTFHRVGMPDAQVWLNLDGQNFQGGSDKPKYPAICGGTYTLNGTVINFNDMCIWTDDFDQSLIMGGTFNITSDQEGGLHIWRTLNGNTDEYDLSKVK